MKFCECPRLVRALGDGIAADPDICGLWIEPAPSGLALVVEVLIGGTRVGALLPVDLTHEDDDTLAREVHRFLGTLRRRVPVRELVGSLSAPGPG